MLQPELYTLGVSLGGYTTTSAVMVLAVYDERPPMRRAHSERFEAGTDSHDILVELEYLIREYRRTCTSGVVRVQLDITEIGEKTAEDMARILRATGATVAEVALPEQGGTSRRRSSVQPLDRRDLIDAATRALRRNRLALGTSPEGETIADQLRSYKPPNGRAKADQWTGERDDIVLALALAVDAASRPLSSVSIATPGNTLMNWLTDRLRNRYGDVHDAASGTSSFGGFGSRETSGLNGTIQAWQDSRSSPGRTQPSPNSGFTNPEPGAPAASPGTSEGSWDSWGNSRDSGTGSLNAAIDAHEQRRRDNP
ncbi:hypothetical protein [Streptomyces sp. cg36]|uniref:hypothetical protein n=1 Tax=Streptomyces sp. cg36 TaxID=3238798 RepID=UPI0034E1FD96